MNNDKKLVLCVEVKFAACLALHLESLFNSISKHLFLTTVTSAYPPDYFFKARWSLELGCSQSQGFVDAQ